MANKAKMAYGSRANLDSAMQSGKVDAFDILLLSGENELPAMGWVDSKTGKPIIIEQTDLSGIETELATKITTKEVDAKIESALNEIECAPITYEKVKYEIVDAPVGTLIDYKEDEIRIMCPADAEYHLQAVGSNGDPNTYYVTLKTYCYNDNVVGYKEHLGSQVDAEILMDLKEDAYGRRYQPTWLGVAKYDSESGVWSYYGVNSSESRFIGWDYRIDWFDANGVMIASDSVRINLSNEGCHYTVEPYYIGKTKTEVEEMITKAVEDATAIEVIEF